MGAWSLRYVNVALHGEGRRCAIKNKGTHGWEPLIGSYAQAQPAFAAPIRGVMPTSGSALFRSAFACIQTPTLEIPTCFGKPIDEATVICCQVADATCINSATTVRLPCSHKRVKHFAASSRPVTITLCMSEG
eukprot:5395027-Amphidinium_carterae.2